MFKRISSKIILALLVAGSVSVQAAEDRGGLKWGSVRALPRLGLDMISTDNLFDKKTREKATRIFVVAPGLKLETGTPVMKYTLDLSAEAGEYDRSHDDDYVDAAIAGTATYQPNKRAKLAFNAGVKSEHDDRGEARTRLGAPAAKPDEYNQGDLGVEFTYGIEGGNGQIIMALDYLDKEYTNNRTQTRILDHDETGVKGIFKWKVSPKIRAVAEGRYRDFDYDTVGVGTTSVDSEENTLLVGAEWKATLNTSGSLMVGGVRKDFSSGARKDISKGIWDAEVKWSPVKPATITFFADRRLSESYGQGSVILDRSHGVSWEHKWIERFSTTAAYTFTDTETIGNTSIQQDDTDLYELSADYKMRRWLKLSAGVSHDDTNDRDPANDYKTNEIFLKAKIDI